MIGWVNEGGSPEGVGKPFMQGGKNQSQLRKEKKNATYDWFVARPTTKRRKKAMLKTGRRW